MGWQTFLSLAALLHCGVLVKGIPATDASYDNETFDYIVVGSGPGGSPVAANLAKAGFKTLLLEAGDDQQANPLEAIPAFGAAASESPDIRWDFFVKHYADNAQALKDPKMVWNQTNGTWYTGLNPPAGATQLGIWYPRVGSLGGCDTHNAGITFYPNKADWQEIVDITGDTTWNPDHMRTYFQKLERNLYLPKGTAGHGFSGYIATDALDPSLVNNDPQLLAISKGSAIALNHSDRATSNDFNVIATLDPNNNAANRDQQEDVYQLIIKMNETAGRSHAGTYASQTAAKYPLTIRLNSFVTKVVFDKNKKATGVQYLAGKSVYRADPRSAGKTGVLKQVTATKEVIISGGAFNTPQLLKLSGLGPKAELQKLGIPVVADLPGVGNNLQDHYEIAIVSQAPSAFTFFQNCTFGATADDPCLAQWRQGKGPYASNGFFEMWTKLSSTTDGVRDLMAFGGPLYFTGFQPGYSSALGPVGSFTFGIVKGRTHNDDGGYVNLKSANPLDTPLINFNYFSKGADKDLQALADGIATARKIFDSVPAPGSPQKELYPGRNVSTPEQVKTYIKNEAYSHHACCTARIGAVNDSLAVLDSKFRVRGVKGLRVVDASAFPKAPGNFPVVSVFTLSEKASDSIINGN